ncbi:MAG: FAD:protein FMN transferase [Desulfomonile tiedjei]|nr:FAD:protein FMN transferase [Desulfomonile tiedjei]
MNKVISGFLRPLGCLVALFIVSCSGKDSVDIHRYSRLLMGTLVEVTVSSPRDKANGASEAVFDEIKRVEDLTSFHKPSGLTSLNDSAGRGPINPDRELLEIIGTALQTAKATKGAFDPTVGVLCRLWSFSGGEPRLPDSSEIVEAVKKVGWGRVKLDNSEGTVFLPETGMALDLGGITKGYALDRVAEALRKHGISSALVNIGGDVLVVGEKEPGKPWRIGVQDPRNPREVVAVAAPKDRVVMTSGDYERFFVKDGKRFHHILNPATGYPAEGAQSVTIVAASGLVAEPLGATIFVLGVDKGLKYIHSLPDVEALVIDPQGQIHMTPGARSLFELKR